MSYPHAIRLAGPWDYRVLRTDSAAAPPSSSGRVHSPTDWGGTLGDEFRGVVRYVRRFNRPTNLDSQERVWLVIEGVDARGRAQLNDEPLGEILGYQQPTEIDVTAQLQLNNALTIDVECPAEAVFPRPGRERLPGGIVGEVRLEIRAAPADR